MKETVIQYKGNNPLVGLPALSFILTHLLLILLIWTHAWDKMDGWEYFFFIVYTIWISSMLYGVAYNLGPDCKPCIVYASKRMIRLSVTATVLLGGLLLLSLLASQKAPSFQGTSSAILYVSTFIGAILLSIQFLVVLFFDTPAKIKPERSGQCGYAFLSPVAGGVSCIILGMYQNNKIPTEIGESSFMMITVSSISFLWFEDQKTGMADREIIPLCTASILWIVSALVANYAYASLASVTFVLPYLAYFLPLILLGFYYYVTAPEES